MNTQSYKYASAAAVVLAILFPIYWLSPHWWSGDSFTQIMTQDIQVLDFWDGLFVLLGVLEITVYAFLLKQFSHQLESTTPSFLLILMMVFVALFHATVFVDVGYALGLFAHDPETLVLGVGIYALIMLFLYAVSAFIFAITLLMRFRQLNGIMKVFATGLLIACVFQFTVILGIINIFLFPILMLLLALNFYRGENEVEVI
ncbi:MAG: hypothetical protein LAT77_02745 [Aliidiomarina sp.]|uniref:hypothetical protein n=1 Tax=Aliidiomarina sp. TaxID=1872439 RepID=UPI0025C1F1F5|nr:hypothetical protein [Aliidiomarina sp.]MCH8500811.1 hypothetical protein [Aliidiomarina sp.]